jgi:serine carboxypeptidase-like clade 1
VLYVCFLTQGSFAFVTVKGGRHEVPESAPAQAMELLTRIIEGTPF